MKNLLSSPELIISIIVSIMYLLMWFLYYKERKAHKRKIHLYNLLESSNSENITRSKKFENQFKEVGVRVIFFPYTKGISSTLINEVLLDLRK